ncbi:MAG: hypothetical protein ACT4NY_28420 [Pseudonocardiales bacterium]
MDPISPVLADAFYLLRHDLYGHLDEADCLANQEREWSVEDRATARKLIGDLVVVIRGLLLEHKVAESGNCRTCPSRWPCPVVTTIHDLVKDPQRQFVALVTRRLETDS